MPVKSQAQAKYIYHLRDEYKSKAKAPKKYKWAFNKECGLKWKNLPKKVNNESLVSNFFYNKLFEDTATATATKEDIAKTSYIFSIEFSADSVSIKSEALKNQTTSINLETFKKLASVDNLKSVIYSIFQKYSQNKKYNADWQEQFFNDDAVYLSYCIYSILNLDIPSTIKEFIKQNLIKLLKGNDKLKDQDILDNLNPELKEKFLDIKKFYQLVDFFVYKKDSKYDFNFIVLGKESLKFYIKALISNIEIKNPPPFAQYRTIDFNELGNIFNIKL